MIVRVRLYRQFDIDLIYLAHYEDFSLIRTAKECLNAYASGTAYKISMPHGRFYSGSEDKTTYMYDIVLDEEKDEAAIRLLRAVRSRHKNSFIKNLLRGYMIAPCAGAYLLNVPEIVSNGTDSFDRLIRSSDTRPPKAKITTKCGDFTSQTTSEEQKQDDKTKEKRSKKTVKESKKKKNAIEALGNIVLKPRETDNFIVPVEPRTSALPPKITRQSVMFPDNPSVSEPVPAATPVHAPIKENDESFDVFDTISNMVNNY